MDEKRAIDEGAEMCAAINAKYKMSREEEVVAMKLSVDIGRFLFPIGRELCNKHGDRAYIIAGYALAVQLKTVQSFIGE